MVSALTAGAGIKKSSTLLPGATLCQKASGVTQPVGIGSRRDATCAQPPAKVIWCAMCADTGQESSSKSKKSSFIAGKIKAEKDAMGKTTFRAFVYSQYNKVLRKFPPLFALRKESFLL
jgi:hypothetical protein